MNCRFEIDSVADQKSQSRYFDAYIVFRETGTHKFAFTLNLHADDETLSAKITLDVTNTVESKLKLAPRVENVTWAGNKYDLGHFSTETDRKSTRLNSSH